MLLGFGVANDVCVAVAKEEVLPVKATKKEEVAEEGRSLVAKIRGGGDASALFFHTFQIPPSFVIH